MMDERLERRTARWTKNEHLAKILAESVKNYAFAGVKLTADVTVKDLEMIIYKELSMTEPDPAPVYWIVEVGDEPGDEHVDGPWDKQSAALLELSSNSKYQGYLYRLPSNGKNFIYWLHQISSLYLVHSLEKPSYNKDIRFNHLDK